MYGYDFSYETIQEIKVENDIVYVKCKSNQPFVRLFTQAGFEYKINPLKDKCLLYLPIRGGSFPINRCFAILMQSEEEITIKNESNCSITLSAEGINIDAGDLPININGTNVNIGNASSDILTKTNFASAIITSPVGLCTVDLSAITNKSKA